MAEADDYAFQRSESLDWHRSRLDLWIAFCQKYRVAEDSVPLFDCDEGGFVQTTDIGKTRTRKVLRRSEAMEIMMRREVKKVVEDHRDAASHFDGIIYIMHTHSSDGTVVPRYIGKSETVGKTLEFYPSISCDLKQIHQSLVAGETTMPITSVI